MKTDVVVIGSGPGGYVAAIRCAQRGLDVTIVEKEKIGGVCLNVGCIPTKALFKNASFIKDLKKSDALGIDIKDYKINFPQMMDRKDYIIKQLTGGVKQLLKKNKVVVVSGTAEVVDSTTIQVKSSDGDTTIKCRYIIIATGSTPIVPPIPGVECEGVMTSKELLAIEKLPESLAIIGGGVIGMEFASIFNMLGVDVTVIERLPKILPSIDSEVTNGLAESLKERGVDIQVSTELKSISSSKGKLMLTLNSDKISVTKVLMSVGRKPVLPEIKNINVKLDKNAIVVNDFMQTNIPNIYCIGDANGKMQLAHVASAEAIVAADHLSIGSKKKMSYKSVPSVVYTIPEIASVGLTEEEARSKGDVLIGKTKYNGNGKALCMGETEGFAKMITGAKHKELLGVHILGYGASNLISEAGLAINLEATAEEIAHTIHAHPTISEIIMECSEAIDFKAIHSL